MKERMGRRSALPAGAKTQLQASARLRLGQPLANVLKSVLIPLPNLFFSLPFLPGQLKASGVVIVTRAIVRSPFYFSVYYAGLFLLILPVSSAQDANYH
jgi:hypothetical protein